MRKRSPCCACSFGPTPLAPTPEQRQLPSLPPCRGQQANKPTMPIHVPLQNNNGRRCAPTPQQQKGKKREESACTPCDEEWPAGMPCNKRRGLPTGVAPWVGYARPRPPLATTGLRQCCSVPVKAPVRWERRKGRDASLCRHTDPFGPRPVPPPSISGGHHLTASSSGDRVRVLKQEVPAAQKFDAPASSRASFPLPEWFASQMGPWRRRARPARAPAYASRRLRARQSYANVAASCGLVSLIVRCP